MATSGTGNDGNVSVTIRFTKQNHDALKTAAALTPTASINSLVNEAVSSHFSSPVVVASLRSSLKSYAAEITNSVSDYQSTLDKLSGKEA